MFFKIDASIDFIEKIDKSRAVEIGVAEGDSLPPHHFLEKMSFFSK